MGQRESGHDSDFDRCWLAASGRPLTAPPESVREPGEVYCPIALFWVRGILFYDTLNRYKYKEFDERRDFRERLREPARQVARQSVGMSNPGTATTDFSSLADLTRPLHVLVVDDDPDYRTLMSDYLLDGMSLPVEVLSAGCLGEARILARKEPVEVILLDLGLPDAAGVRAIKDLRQLRGDIAIVVVTGAEEALQENCLQAGAQDFLTKTELNEKQLVRSVGSALFWLRDRQYGELSNTLEVYRRLSSAGSGSPLASFMVGLGSLRTRQPLLFQRLLIEYRHVADAYFHALAVMQKKPLDLMQELISHIGRHNAGPRDLMDLHVATFEGALQSRKMNASGEDVSQGRLLVLEMMGMLVNYYRLGSSTHTH